MLTISLFLAVAAFIVTIASAIGRAPLWVAVLILSVCQLLTVIPVR